MAARHWCMLKATQTHKIYVESHGILVARKQYYSLISC